MIKKQPIEFAEKELQIANKELMCSKHDKQYSLKCESKDCEYPLICDSLECIASHFHQDRLMIKKFCPSQFQEKVNQLDNIIQDAKKIKAHVDQLKDSIKKYYGSVFSMKQNYKFLTENASELLDSNYIQKVYQNYEMGKILRKSLENMKESVNIEFSFKDSYFCLRKYLINFLAQNIKGFSWNNCQEVYSSKNQLISCKNFHKKLAGLKDLLFIFIGKNIVIGSYFSCEYPSLAEKVNRDPNSFIFMSKGKHFIKFSAIKNAQKHLSVSEKSYICQGNTSSYGDGILTFHKNFDTLLYCLPSKSYDYEDKKKEIYNGSLKIDKFMILKHEFNEIKNP